MTDDLVKRLRSPEVFLMTSGMISPVAEAAADRIKHLENRCFNLLVGNGILNIHIEKLEAALREIAALGFWDGDSAMSIARKALEGKDD